MVGPWAMDPEALSRTSYTLLHAFKILGSKVKSLESSPDGSQLCIKYSEVPEDRLCWQFAQYGFCHRQRTCRWEHVAMETFIITLVMQPLAPPPPTELPG